MTGAWLDGSTDDIVLDVSTVEGLRLERWTADHFLHDYRRRYWPIVEFWRWPSAKERRMRSYRRKL